MSVNLTKDKKGRCWYVSTLSAGMTVGIFLTPEDLLELKNKIEEVIT